MKQCENIDKLIGAELTSSSLVFCTRVGNLSLLRSSTNGGCQLGGGTMQQIPYRSLCSRIDWM
eukprot:6198583-Pleurochrysis_carterae.AAC.3